MLKLIAKYWCSNEECHGELSLHREGCTVLDIWEDVNNKINIQVDEDALEFYFHCTTCGERFSVKEVIKEERLEEFARELTRAVKADGELIEYESYSFD
jgi:hypothetical protein